MNSVGYKIKKNNFIHIIDPSWSCMSVSIPAYGGQCHPKRRRHYDIVYPDPWGSAGEQLEDGI